MLVSNSASSFVDPLGFTGIAKKNSSTLVGGLVTNTSYEIEWNGIFTGAQFIWSKPDKGASNFHETQVSDSFLTLQESFESPDYEMTSSLWKKIDFSNEGFSQSGESWSSWETATQSYFSEIQFSESIGGKVDATGKPVRQIDPITGMGQPLNPQYTGSVDVSIVETDQSDWNFDGNVDLLVGTTDLEFKANGYQSWQMSSMETQVLYLGTGDGTFSQEGLLIGEQTTSSLYGGFSMDQFQRYQVSGGWMNEIEGLF